MVQLSHPYMTTWKIIVLIIWTLVGKVMSLLFNTLSRFVITFFPTSERFLVLWLQSPSAVILEPREIKYVTVSTFSPSICHELMGPDAMILVFFECWVLSQLLLKTHFFLYSSRKPYKEDTITLLILYMRKLSLRDDSGDYPTWHPWPAWKPGFEPRKWGCLIGPLETCLISKYTRKQIKIISASNFNSFRSLDGIVGRIMGLFKDVHIIIPRSLDGIVGRIMGPLKDVHIIIPRICEHNRLHSKGYLRLQMELKFLISWSEDMRLSWIAELAQCNHKDP